MNKNLNMYVVITYNNSLINWSTEVIVQIIITKYFTANKTVSGVLFLFLFFKTPPAVSTKMIHHIISAPPKKKALSK